MFDHQKIKLISLTQPNEFDTPEELVSYIARVSNPSNQTNFHTAAKLLTYCMNNSHWSVFAMADATFEIITTRDIGRQILRHKSFDFQEFSQRYADPTESLGLVFREARLQDTKNRQNSIDIDDNLEYDAILNEWDRIQEVTMHHAITNYKWAITNGIAKEQARAILPEGMTLSRMYMKGNLRSWIHYCKLRMGEGTQKEHREIAIACWELLTDELSFLNEFDYTDLIANFKLSH